jgi:hypothetical protein
VISHDTIQKLLCNSTAASGFGAVSKAPFTLDFMHRKLTVETKAEMVPVHTQFRFYFTYRKRIRQNKHQPSRRRDTKSLRAQFRCSLSCRSSFYRPSLLQTESRKEVERVKLKGGAFAQAINF